MYEGSGGPSFSCGTRLTRYDLETGEISDGRQLPTRYFGEGICGLGDKIYQVPNAHSLFRDGGFEARASSFCNCLPAKSRGGRGCGRMHAPIQSLSEISQNLLEDECVDACMPQSKASLKYPDSYRGGRMWGLSTTARPSV
jgi:hypothetical protein